MSTILGEIIELVWQFYKVSLLGKSLASWIPALIFAAPPALIAIGCFAADNVRATLILGAIAILPLAVKAIARFRL
jgi:hypothetical protein